MNISLDKCDLVVDAVYGGSRNGNASDDPLPKLLGVDNGAGFRHLGERSETRKLKLLVLKSNFNDNNWPDHLDHQTGTFIYFGDNRTPRDLHDTPRQGNHILRNLFASAHTASESTTIPPILLFGGTGVYRDVKFLGLAVPSAEGMSTDEDLVAVWKTSSKTNTRFQNYRATFTILDVPVIKRAWINDIRQGNAHSSCHAPRAWLDWLQYRTFTPLKSEHAESIRSKQEQLPRSQEEKEILDLILDRYATDKYGFETCALRIAKLLLPRITSSELTRPWKDGGRDGIGKYQIGAGRSSIHVDFALEAKCYATTNGVGVKETSRLISRIRHRQFGVLVTTSYLAEQAYKEIIEDQHPIIVISAADICQILQQKVGTKKSIALWLKSLN